MTTHRQADRAAPAGTTAGTGPSGLQTVGTAAAVVSAVVPPFLVGALADEIRHDLTFTTGQLGLAMAACYTVTGLLSPLGGRFVAMIGAPAALRATCAMSTVGLVAIACATSAAHLILALAFVGVPNALTQPSSNELLSGVESPRRRALAFGLVQASIPAASLVAGALLAASSLGSSWRWSILAVATATVLAQVLLPGRARPTTEGSSPSGRRKHTTTAHGPLVGGPTLMAALVAAGCLASASATALPSFVATSGTAAGLAAGLVAAAQVSGSLFSVVVRIAAPVATSQASLSRRLLTVAGLHLLGGGAMLAVASGTRTGFLLGTLCAFAFGWGWNALFNLVVALARPAGIAAATGITQTGVFLGGAIGPLVFAALIRVGDHDAAWIAMATLMIAAAVSTTWAAQHVRTTSDPARPTTRPRTRS